MRPVLAVLGGAILVLIALATYFVPGGYSAGGTVYQGSSEVLQTPSGYSFLPTVPVTLTVTGLPPGANVEVVPCPIGATTVQQCTSSPGPFLDAYNYSSSSGYALTVTLKFDINAGHPFLVSTSASQGANVQVQESIPLWAVYTWFITAALVASIVLVAVGLHHEPKPQRPSYYVDQSGYAAGPAPRRFCESCGAPYTDPTTAFCTNCGAPRS